jgi:hypothetical protein
MKTISMSTGHALISILASITALFLVFISGARPDVLRSDDRGEATYYGNSAEMTCAIRDRSIAPGSLVLVTTEHRIPERAVALTVVGYLPEDSKASVDLSPAAFVKLAPLREGRIKVRVRKIYP